MKHIITLTLAIALASLTLSAKEVATNPETKMTLSEDLGVYTITGPKGILLLGNKEKTYNTLFQLEKMFCKELINQVISTETEDEKFEVKEDEQGLYVIKVGTGLVKLRHKDVTIFLAKLGWKDTKQATVNAFNAFKDTFKK